MNIRFPKRQTATEIFQLAWPMILGMMSYTVIDITDTMLVGWLGKQPLAAVGFATTVTFFMFSFFIGFFESIKILVSQATGAEDESVIRDGAWQGIFIAFPCGLLLCFLTPFSHLLFEFTGRSAEFQAIGTEYFNIRLFAAPLWFVMLALVSFYQGTGDTRTPMYLNFMVCGINVVLDIALIQGRWGFPEMGPAGASVGTAIATGIGCLVIFGLFIRKVGFSPRFHPKVAFKLMRVGLPVGFRWLLDHGSWAIITYFILTLGDAQLAANQIVIKIMLVAVLPIYGLSEAGCILAGKRVGAGDFDGVGDVLRGTLALGLFVSLFFGMAFVFAPDFFISFFNSEQDVIDYGASLLVLVAFYQVATSLEFGLAGVLNGTGDTKFPMAASMVNAWVFQLPLAWVVGIYYGFEARGIWMVCVSTVFFLAAALVLRYKSGVWRSMAIISKSPIK